MAQDSLNELGWPSNPRNPAVLSLPHAHQVWSTMGSSKVGSSDQTQVLVHFTDDPPLQIPAAICLTSISRLSPHLPGFAYHCLLKTTRALSTWQSLNKHKIQTVDRGPAHKADPWGGRRRAIGDGLEQSAMMHTCACHEGPIVTYVKKTDL